MKRRKERKEREEERKSDNVDDCSKDENPPNENEDMQLLISQCFELCLSKCCLAFAHVGDEGKDEFKHLVKLCEEDSVIDDPVEKVGAAAADEDPTDKDIHVKMVEHIGLKCISGVLDEHHSHTSKSHTYEAPCMTSTPYVSTMTGLYNENMHFNDFQFSCNISQLKYNFNSKYTKDFQTDTKIGKIDDLPVIQKTKKLLRNGLT